MSFNLYLLPQIRSLQYAVEGLQIMTFNRSVASARINFLPLMALALGALTGCDEIGKKPAYLIKNVSEQSPSTCNTELILDAFQKYPQTTAASAPRNLEVAGLRAVALELRRSGWSNFDKCSMRLEANFRVAGFADTFVAQNFSINYFDDLICLNTQDGNYSLEDNEWLDDFPWKSVKSGKIFPNNERVFLAPCFDVNGDIVEYYDDN